MVNDEQVTLATLPSDVIRKIIRFELSGKGDNRRLISRRWNELVLDELPLIGRLLVHYDKEPHPELSIITINYGFPAGDRKCEVHLVGEDFKPYVVSVIRQCKRIGLLHISVDNIHVDTFNELQRYLGNKEVGRMFLSHVNHFGLRSRISRMIVNCSVHALEMRCLSLQAEALRSLLHETIPSLKSVKIYEKSNDPESMLGESPEHWEDVMRKLNMDGRYVARFLSSNDESNRKIFYDGPFYLRIHVTPSAVRCESIVESLKAIRLA